MQSFQSDRDSSSDGTKQYEKRKEGEIFKTIVPGKLSSCTQAHRALRVYVLRPRCQLSHSHSYCQPDDTKTLPEEYADQSQAASSCENAKTFSQRVFHLSLQVQVLAHLQQRASTSTQDASQLLCLPSELLVCLASFVVCNMQ